MYPSQVLYEATWQSMIGEAIGIGLCVLLWAARVYVATKYEIQYRIAGETHRAWRRGTPDWIMKVMPWLGFLSWVALLGLIAWCASGGR